jgi:hypothetical protein
MAHPLQGKAVQFKGSGRRTGTFCGIVRKVTLTRATKKKPAVIKTLVVQRIGGELAVSGKTYSAKCGGERIRLVLEDVLGVSWFGKLRPVVEFLEKAGTVS